MIQEWKMKKIQIREQAVCRVGFARDYEEEVGGPSFDGEEIGEETEGHPCVQEQGYSQTGEVRTASVGLDGRQAEGQVGAELGVILTELKQVITAGEFLVWESLHLFKISGVMNEFTTTDLGRTEA